MFLVVGRVLRRVVLVKAAIAAVPSTVRAHALAQVTAYTREVNRAASDPNANTVEAHNYWACTARENGASEQEISAARQEGHTTAAQRLSRGVWT